MNAKEGTEEKVKTAGTKVVEVREHPLLKIVPMVSHSFAEWLERWNKTTDLAEKMGLLHFFLIDEDKECWWDKTPKLISFLLEIADGHVHGNFKNIIEAGGIISIEAGGVISKRRQSIAKKAFAVLCLKFFKGAEKRDEAPLWGWMLDDEELFQKVLWFLRSDETCYRYLYNSCNSGDNHGQEIYRAFLKEFSRLGWEFGKYHSWHANEWAEEDSKTIRKRLVAARPRFIEILAGLRELDWLDSPDRELDAASLRRLIKMAMSEYYSFPYSYINENAFRKPETLEEAVLGGSAAAEIVILYRIRQKERRRIETEFDKSRRQYEKERRKQELAEINKQKENLDNKAKELQEGLR